MHTHYDGQAMWDPLLAPSCWHGVTTVLFGNCGVGFAPVKKHHRQGLMDLMEGVEEIPGVVLAALVVWSLPIKKLRWLVLIVVLYAGVQMLRSAYKERKARASSLPL